MNRVVHFEIHASDVECSKKFYETVFGWNTQQMGSEYGDYVLLITGPGPDEMAKGVKMEDLGINGGMMKRKGDAPAVGAPVNGFVNIIGVEDVDATVEKAKAAGGKIALEKMDVPNVGELAYLLDPDNNIFGIIKPVMPAAA